MRLGVIISKGIVLLLIAAVVVQVARESVIRADSQAAPTAPLISAPTFAQQSPEDGTPPPDELTSIGDIGISIPGIGLVAGNLTFQPNREDPSGQIGTFTFNGTVANNPISMRWTGSFRVVDEITGHYELLIQSIVDVDVPDNSPIKDIVDAILASNVREQSNGDSSLSDDEPLTRVELQLLNSRLNVTIGTQSFVYRVSNDFTIPPKPGTTYRLFGQGESPALSDFGTPPQNFPGY